MRRDSLFSIAPDLPFLTTLAARVLDGTLLGGWPREGAFWLSDVTIIVPTRRARLKLAEAFATLRGGATLLPDIRTFGGEASEEEPFLPPFDTPNPREPMSPLSRTLTLARMVDAWARTEKGQEILASPPNAAEILGLAQSLGSLVDDIAIEGVPVGNVLALPPEPLACNWQRVLEFLRIALVTWPLHLAAQGRADAAELRNERLRRQAGAAARSYGDRPVIAAGSTGSIPATADLLRAITELERGVVVLPGLDTTLSTAAHEALLDPGRLPHGHPQYGLARLLRHLGTSHGTVIELAPSPLPRLAFVRAALGLAETTAQWPLRRRELDGLLPAAMAGMTILAARTLDDEARAIAIAAREALADGRTVGIVSPDQTLSRRIASELGRFDIEVDDAAGTPLFQSPTGRLMRLALAVATEKFAAVPLMSLLQNRQVGLGLGRAEVGRIAGLIDLGLLRGQRSAVGLAGLRALLLANVAGTTKYPGRRLSEADGQEISGLFAALETALAPLTDLVGRAALRAADLAAALAKTLAALTAGAGGAAPGLAEATRWAEELAGLEGEGPAFPPVALDTVLAALMAGIKVTSPRPGRDDIAIWGRLEARLMAPDLMILAGLNEEVWPEAADPGPWLSRGMRLAAGLEPPERQQGQAAHDFEMAVANPQVILAYSERRGTSPALPSRLLQRLEAFLGMAASTALRDKGRRFIELARQVDAVAGEPVPAIRPVPSPPAALRPRRLSVTEIETLFRSPYDLYARHVLGLKPLAALGEAPDARERGSMIHAVFELFVRQGHDFSAPEAQQRLMALAAAEFVGLEAIGERRDIWLKRFERAAAEFLAYERAREPLVLRRHAEVSGTWTMPIGFTLSGKADRVDELRDGTLEILDFKTGGIPTPKVTKAFEAPQLLLEAAMAGVGAFAEVPAADASALTYIKIGLGPDALKTTSFKVREGLTLPAAVDQASRLLQGHVEALLLSGARPMAARIRPDITRRYSGDYDHLARTDEWTIAAGEDE